MGTINLKQYGKDHPVTFVTSTYANNGNLRVDLVTYENGYPEPWSNLTVNISKCEENCAFIDVNNNGKAILDWLFENGLGSRTGGMERSGFVVYPEFKFNMDKLKEFMDNDTMEMDDEEPEFESIWGDD